MAKVDYGTLPPIPARDSNGRFTATRVGKVIDLTLKTKADLDAAGVFPALLTPLPGYPDLVLVEARAEFPSRGDSSPRIIESYIEATDTPYQLGDVTVRPAGGRAFVDTDTNGAIVSGTRFAREWEVRYLVKGDVTSSDGQWLAVNAALAFGVRTGYLTETGMVRRGLTASIISRTYNEKPDKLVYDTRSRYFFPGKLGFESAEPVVTEVGVTRETTIEVEETYHVGEVAALSLEFEVLYWARGALNFTVDATGEEGTKSYTFPGCIGNVSISASNRIFNGVYCSAVAGGVSSSPSTYPTGKKRISSRAYPWKGDLWIRRSEYVTFPA